MTAAPKELAKLRERAREIADLGGVAGLLLWDQNTLMPRGGAGARADQLEALERIQHERLTDPGLAEPPTAPASKHNRHRRCRALETTAR